MPGLEILSFKSGGDLARVAAGEFVDWISAATGNAMPARVALSGGRIVQPFFSEVARIALPRRLPWHLVHFFWADERCVPPPHEESNFTIANNLLLKPLAIPQANIHRIRGEEEPASAARSAAAELRSLSPQSPDGTPKLGLVLLGMGEDGHTASLFPGGIDETAVSREVYLPVVAAKPPPNRITLTYRVLFAAESVWVLASGNGKQHALADGLNPAGKTPLAQVIRNRQQVRVFKDFPLPDVAG